MPRIDQILIQTITKLINQFTDFIPNFIQSILVFLIGLLIAKVIGFIISKVFAKAGADKLGEQLNDLSIAKKMKMEFVLSTIVSKVVYYYIIMIFLGAAAETLNFSVVTDLVRSLLNLVPKIIVAAIILLIGALVADILQKVVTNACLSLNISAGKLIGNVIFFFFMAIVVIAALGQAGINTALLESSFNLLIAGVIFAFSIGYGIASKDTLSNIIAGFYSKSQFKEGQTVEIDDVKGTVKEVTSSSIVIVTDNAIVIIPMSTTQTKKVKIYS
jgi:small-conductance mechanosensitive channel